MPETPTNATSGNLLVASPTSWRDVCFSLPAVRSLAAAGNSIQLLCPEPQRWFWIAAGFDAVIAYDPGASARSIAGRIAETPRALLWEPGPAADACAKAGIAERIGLAAPKLAKRLTRTLERTVKPGPPMHEVRRFLDLAELLGADPMQAAHFAPIGTPRAESEGPLLVVPESDFGSHYEWPQERWAEVIEHLKERGENPVIGGMRDPGPSKDVAGKTDCPHQLVDFSDPATFGDHGRLIAADGSLAHLAAALGTRCTVLFGPGDPELTRPLGKHHRIIRRKVECSPCFLDRCPLDLRCQDDLGADRVIGLWESLNPA